MSRGLAALAVALFVAAGVAAASATSVVHVVGVMLAVIGIWVAAIWSTEDRWDWHWENLEKADVEQVT